MNQENQEQQKESIIIIITELAEWLLLTATLAVSAILLLVGMVMTIISPEIADVLFYIYSGLTLGIHIFLKKY